MTFNHISRPLLFNAQIQKLSNLDKFNYIDKMSSLLLYYQQKYQFKKLIVYLS